MWMGGVTVAQAGVMQRGYQFRLGLAAFGLPRCAHGVTVFHRASRAAVALHYKLKILVACFQQFIAF
jgi:hypothetical protein